METSPVIRKKREFENGKWKMKNQFNGVLLSPFLHFQFSISHPVMLWDLAIQVKWIRAVNSEQ